MRWITFHSAAFLETFVEYPPSQEPASFTIEPSKRRFSVPAGADTSQLADIVVD
jgi:hypothetical protein